MDPRPPIRTVMAHQCSQHSRPQQGLRPDLHRRHLHRRRLPARSSKPRPRHRLALGQTRVSPRLHTTAAWYRRTVMRRPRRRPRRLLSDQSLLAHDHDPALPRPRPTRHPSLHHITAPHRRWQSDLCPSFETDQDHHLGPSTRLDTTPARLRSGLQTVPQRKNTATKTTSHTR